MSQYLFISFTLTIITIMSPIFPILYNCKKYMEKYIGLKHRWLIIVRRYLLKFHTRYTSLMDYNIYTYLVNDLYLCTKLCVQHMNYNIHNFYLLNLLAFMVSYIFPVLQIIEFIYYLYITYLHTLKYIIVIVSITHGILLYRIFSVVFYNLYDSNYIML